MHPAFEQHPAVINGFSELMAEVFGEENGVGVRSAVGMILPSNIAVEVEAILNFINNKMEKTEHSKKIGTRLKM